MLKHTEINTNSVVRRQDTTWKYEWDVNNPDKFGTIFLDPSLSTNVSSILSISSEVGNVTIDPIPPEFLSDEETDYVILSPKYNVKDGPEYELVQDSLRHIEIQFKDKAGLDFKQFSICLGDKTLYEYKRPELDNDPTYKGKFLTGVEECIKNIKVKYDGINRYSIAFDLVNGQNLEDRFFATPYELLNIGYSKTAQIPDLYYLNKIPENVSTIGEWIEYFEGTQTVEPQKGIGNVSVLVYDLAGNVSRYSTEKEFWTIDVNDIEKLTPVQINFFDVEPSTYFVNDSTNGSVWCNAQDLCKPLWRFPVVAQTLDTSVGSIDPTTYGPIEWREKTKDKGVYNVLTGCRVFKLHNIREHGFIEVEAWVETGNKKIDALLKERTYNTGKCGPWIYEDGGRKYDLLRYVPSYLRNTDFNDFIEWFQLFLNTMYVSLDKNKNISVLEKIARIGNFNDIDQIENHMLMHYEKEYANEFPFDKSAIQNMNTLLTTVNWDVKDDEEVNNTIKYVLSNLPSYNKYKGSNVGYSAALKMFGFSCKVVNLWVHIKNSIEENPNFIEEDRLLNKSSYFQTSRFNIEVMPNSYFEQFNEHLDFFINLIKSIKPITKILDSIKYTVAFRKELYIVSSTQTITSNEHINLKLYWMIDEQFIKDLNRTVKISENQNYCHYLSIPYTVTETIPTSNQHNFYTLIGKLFECSKSDITLYVEDNSNTYEFTIPYSHRQVILNSGKFTVGSTDGETKNILYNLYRKIIETNEDNREKWLRMNIYYSVGTNFIRSYKDINITQNNEVQAK